MRVQASQFGQGQTVLQVHLREVAHAEPPTHTLEGDAYIVEGVAGAGYA